MAKRKDEEINEEEEKIRKLVDGFNEQLVKEMEGKPYLMVLATLHEIDREGGKSKLATQWNWRSNIDPREEGRSEKEIETGRIMMKFLADRMKDVVESPEGGIKAKYKLD
jgi:hypothetical protein